MNKGESGFTLIELLVVVLIIGILAAIALPQYQKAVWHARAMELVTLTSTVSKARQAAYLEKGRWVTDVHDLDITLPISPNCTSEIGWNEETQSPEYCAEYGDFLNEDIIVSLNLWETGASETRDLAVTSGFFEKGPYTGFFVFHSDPTHIGVRLGKIYCIDALSEEENTGFCEKIMHGKKDFEIPEMGLAGYSF